MRALLAAASFVLLLSCGSEPAVEPGGDIAAVAVSGGGVTVDVVNAGFRAGGFYGAVRITNGSFPSSITSFQVVFKMPGASVSSSMGGTVTVTGPDASGNFTAASTSSLTYQPIMTGQTRDFRFNGTGTFTSSTIVSVRINGQTIPIGGDSPPVVTLASSSTSVTTASTVTLTATATDDRGVSRVEFYEGTTLLGSDTTAPYTRSVSFTSANNGSHAYTARAYDTASQVTTSAPVNVSVNIGGGGGGGVSINAGGAATGSFGADQYFSGGSTYSNSATIDTSLLTNPPPAAIFNSERYGSFTYTIPGLTAGASYTVTLYFAETYLSAAGQRTFNVALNGTTALTSFDIYAAAGARNRAVSRTLTAAASASGQIAIQFVPGVQNPKVNGLAVAPAGGSDLPPTVALGSSSTNVTTASTVTLTATASDDKGVARVEFYEGTTLLASDTTAPYTCAVSFTSANNGAHTYTARAYDTIGQSATSGPVTVTVNIGGADAPPTVSLASSSTNVTATGSITLTATAADDRGVNKVEFYEGATLLGTDTTSPYTQVVSFTSANNGTHTYTARAYDTINQVATSAAVTVTVNIGGTGGTTVALIQSSKANASEITQDDIKTMITQAVDQAGGLGFITNGMTVVLKPNLLTHLAACYSGSTANSPTVNGVTTDWRVVRAVAELVRARNPSGRILVMEGSARSTTAAFQAMGYTSANFGTYVDQFIALEGAGCTSRDTSALVQRAGKSGKQYWINSQYVNADVVISIAVLKTHGNAAVTGCVKNLGMGTTPAGAYSTSTDPNNCTRNYTQSGVPSYLSHSTTELGDMLADYYSIKPADFAIMDGLQGMQNGPCSTSAADKMNMRLVLASRNAVALDAVASRIMSCDPTKVQALVRAQAYGLGTIDAAQISVVGNRQIADVKKLFRSGVSGVCQ